MNERTQRAEAAAGHAQAQGGGTHCKSNTPPGLPWVRPPSSGVLPGAPVVVAVSLAAAAAAAALAAAPTAALAQSDGPDTTDEFNALLAETVADVFGRTLDEITGGGGSGSFAPPIGGAPGSVAQGLPGSQNPPSHTIFDDDADITLHIPPKMIVGVQYEGLLFIDEPRQTDTPVSIAIDGGTRMDMPPLITIPAGDNHAVFPIRAEDVHEHAVLGATQTTVTIHAIPPTGDQAVADTTVYIASFQPAALYIAAPTGPSSDTVRTATSDVPIRVVLVDGTGTPVDAEADVPVRLTSSSSTVRFSAGAGEADDISLFIRHGESSADATIVANGDATVYAAAVGLKSDHIVIDHDDRDIVVRLGVAPSPVVQTTVGYYYVWLEKDGALYVPDDILDVRMSSTHPDRVRFTSDVGPGGEFHYGLMEGGMMRGVFYAIDSGRGTGDAEGEANLFASVAGYGGAEERIEVRPKVSSEAILVVEGEDEVWYKVDTPNTLRLWVYPDVPSERAWAVVGLYTTPFDVLDMAVGAGGSTLYGAPPPVSVVVGGNATASASVGRIPSSVSTGNSAGLGYRSATGNMVAGCDEALCPVHGENIFVTVTSDGGLRHSPSVDIGGGSAISSYETLTSRSVRTSAAPDASDAEGDLHQGRFFPSSAAELSVQAVTATDHTITVSADGLMPDTIDFASRPAYGYEGSVLVTPIPSRMDDPSEIAFISITDGKGGGYIVEPGATHRPGDARAIQTGSTIAGLEIEEEWVGGTAVIRGTFTDEAAEVFVQVPGLHSRPASMTVPGAHTAVEAWLPPRANVGEPFPVAIHTVNDAGVPVEAIRDASAMRVASGDVVITNGGAGGSLRMTAASHGIVQFNVLADGVFSTTRPLESFINPHETDVSVGSPTSDVIQLGEGIAIDVSTGSIGTPHVSVQGSGGLAFAPDPLQPGRYAATPNALGTYSVDVRVAGEGWDAFSTSLTFDVEEFVEATFSATADDGVAVPSTLILTALTVPEDGTMQVPNGGAVSVHPGIFEATIDSTINIGGDRIYGLTGLSSGGESMAVSERFTLPIQRDTAVRASYQRNIDVDFAPIFDSDDPDVAVAVEGSGSYRYGEDVVLEAVPAPELYGLVWHMPDRWGGLPDDADVSPDKMLARFEALDTAVGSVEFRKDYSIMTMLIVLGAAGAGFVVWRKAPADTVYNIQDGLLSAGGKLAKVVERPKRTGGKRTRKKDGGKGGAGDAEGGGGEGEGADGDGGNGDGGDDDGDDGAGKAAAAKKQDKKGRMGGGLRALIKGGDED